MRVADYIFNYLADYGVRHVFLVVGGGSMYLNDALKKQKRIKHVCFHHEQACAMAAEGYYRSSARMPVICLTSGPGGTNALTGILGAWLDSCPMIILSGQVKQETLKYGNLRQLGDQEADIISIVKPITKYAKMLTGEDHIKWELPQAIMIALTERPGPVWLDLPLDIQRSPLL